MAKPKKLTIRQVADQYGIDLKDIPKKGARLTWKEFEDYLEQYTAALNAAKGQ